MTECSNTEVRDLLPDYAAERLPAGDRAMIDGHLAACAACRNELALLRVARAVRPLAVSIDVARIVAALPAQPALRPHLVLSDGHGELEGGRSAGRAASLAPRMQTAPSRSRGWSGVRRVAAAIGVIAIGGLSAIALRDSLNTAGGAAVAVSNDVQNRDSIRLSNGTVVSARGETLAVNTGAGESTGTAGARASAIGSALSLGDLSEYSDDELQRVLEGLEKFDGATSVEPFPSLPIVPVSRGTL
ncbi:MAG: zf-HC2 domain-containing protein [Gemmatimonas sp.]